MVVVESLVTKSWHKGCSARDHDGDEVPLRWGVSFDLFGAIQRVQMILADNDATFNDRNNARNLLPFATDFLINYSYVKYGVAITSIAEFNDDEHTTHEEVKELVGMMKHALLSCNL